MGHREGHELPIKYDVSGGFGTPLCATVDGQTMEDDTITVRERDSMQQTRVKIDALGEFIRDRSREYTR